MANRYYWLKLHKDFFTSKRIKKLRKLAGGDTFTIIYLKMQLLAINSGGQLKYTGLEGSFAEEIALDIDEDTDNVKITISYLLSCGLMEDQGDGMFYLPYVADNTGSEGAGAERMRRLRSKKTSQCDTSVTQVLQVGDVEIEIESDKEIDKELYKERESDIDAFPPTLDQVSAYILERHLIVNGAKWYSHYSSKNWMIGSVPMSDWKASLLYWDATDRERQKKDKKKSFSYGMMTQDYDIESLERELTTKPPA